MSTAQPTESTFTRRPVQETEHEQRIQQLQIEKEVSLTVVRYSSCNDFCLLLFQCLQKTDALEGNLHIPILSALHETLGAARTESTYVADRLAGEPKHGPVTNIPAPVAPIPIFGTGDSNNKFGGTGTSGTSDGDAAVSAGFDALAALEGTAGSRCGFMNTLVYCILFKK